MKETGFPVLDRTKFLFNLDNVSLWDIIIIGGGATGLGAALDSASRGFKTLLLEQSDFAKCTSSRSTKLVHGGVRYLAQGNLALVYEALRERGYLLKNAPHVVKKQSFIIPCYNWKSKWKYLSGLKIYDWMSGLYSFGKSEFLSKEKVLKLLPDVNPQNLIGGIKYFDGQFDDARLAINLAQTCAEQGGTLLNYFKVTGLLKDEDGKINGLRALDVESTKEYSINCKAIINATGVFVDDILNMDLPLRKPLVRPSQGVHLVVDQSFMRGNSALLIPKTSDGRVLFAVPWHNHVLLGTTDTPIQKSSLEPLALEEEIDFILDTAGRYLTSKPKREDVLSVFAGLRPLAASEDTNDKTKEISRSHKIVVSKSGLITITGGKWTTYRKMAEDVIDRAIKQVGLSKKTCSTSSLKIHGFEISEQENFLSIYGSDQTFILDLIKDDPRLDEKLHSRLPYIAAEVVWAVRNEMARTLEDVLARRLRALFLDANASIDMAPRVAEIMAAELNYDSAWQSGQVKQFEDLAKHYCLTPYRSEKSFPLTSNNI
ncbi:MAG: glycerol-3-phosphate dehydrogenase/oxidase [Daejeonella sp.]